MYGDKPVIGFRVGIIIEPDDVGFYAYCPALKGLHTCGDTEEEALENAKNAAIAYLESSIKHDDPIPVGVILEEEIQKISPSREHVSHHTEDLQVACAI